MKKTNFFKISVLSLLLLCATMTSVSAYVITGTFENLKGFHETGYTVLKGDWIEVTLQGYGNEKQVYARMGAEGEYSDWISSESFKAYKKNYGPFGSIGNGKYDYKYNYR